jgi:hypothetical protein
VAFVRKDDPGAYFSLFALDSRGCRAEDALKTGVETLQIVEIKPF